jgi:N-acetylglutamate synthase-like GNAT family acetyltransferase
VTLRRASPGDVPAILAFLRRHEALSLPPLEMVAAGALDAPGPDGLEVWLSGAPDGLVGLTRAGMVLPQWPDRPDWAVLRGVLAGRDLAGVLGPAGQVRPLIAALGLREAPRRQDADEQGLAMDLADLAPSGGAGHLTGLHAAAPGLVEDWRADHLVRTLGLPVAGAAAAAVADVARWQKAGNHRLLWVEGQPVALCAMNAVLPDVVQLARVHVPPALRGRGHARRAVTLLLAEARDRGAARALVFTASEAAARVCRSIGFRPVGAMGLVLFEGPQRVPQWH